MRRAGLLAIIATTAGLALTAAPAGAWAPEPASYGVGTERNMAVTGAGGVTLYANVYYPTDRRGHAAPGPFPVILSQTPYGKDDGAVGGQLGGLGGTSTYFVQRGYIAVVADVRGTGASPGE
jgi:uncharacterized protein